MVRAIHTLQLDQRRCTLPVGSPPNIRENYCMTTYPGWATSTACHCTCHSSTTLGRTTFNHLTWQPNGPITIDINTSDDPETEDENEEDNPFWCRHCLAITEWQYNRTCYHSMNYRFGENRSPEGDCDRQHNADGDIQQISCINCGREASDTQWQAMGERYPNDL
jgi:hypothetical protein